MRVGMGYDVHRLIEGRDLILGGVTIPYEKGLLGHSDADVLLHAVMDALLGACALGDIGKFLALIILVLQLAAAGGTFPVETIDKGFRFLNPLLPMTYTIKVFKECLISTSTNFIGKNTLVLIGFAVVLGVITLGVEIIKMKKEKKNAKNA